MKIRISGGCLLQCKNNPWIRWSRRLFFVIGILALGYVGFALLDARLYQADQSRRFQQELNGLKPSIISDEHLRASSMSPTPAKESLMIADRY